MFCVPSNRRQIALALVATLLLIEPAAAQEKKSFGDSFKSGMGKLFGKKDPVEPVPVESVPASLSINSNKKPGPNVYTAVAQLYEQHGKLDLAEQQYRMAMKVSPNDLTAMLGLARLKELAHKPDEALSLYQQAAKAHPNKAAAFNNLGMFYARRDQNQEALVSLGRAIMLEPTSVLYRNNMATVLVEMGRAPEAFNHLRSAHPEAVAHYNLGYLLEKKGKTAEATECFATALRIDPTLGPAQHCLARLQPGPGAPASSPAMVAANPQPSRSDPLPAVARGGAMPESASPTSSVPRVLQSPPALTRASVPVLAPSSAREIAPAEPVTAPLPQPELEGPLPLPRVGSLRLSDRPGVSTETAPLPPELRAPMRLPPTQPAASEVAPSKNDPALPSAPMPPDSGVRRLPFVR